MPDLPWCCSLPLLALVWVGTGLARLTHWFRPDRRCHMPKASDYRSCPPPARGQAADVRDKLQPTPPDILGPFYRPGAPEYHEFAKLVTPATLYVEGRVMDRDGVPVADAVLDVWQADEAGKYDNTGFHLRGRVAVSGEDDGSGGNAGRFSVGTVKPGYYDISEPTDPEPHEFRCSHIHVIVTAPGFKTLTTQLYFADSKYDESDRWFDARRCVKPTDVPGRVSFDFVLERD